jgi:NAD(P) transhydrogenase subunit alpha
MRIAVAKEYGIGERRVALVPEGVSRLTKAGMEVWVEAGAGENAFFPDTAYAEAGAKIVAEAGALWGEADILLKVGPPAERQGQHEVELLHAGVILLGFLNPLGNPVLVRRLVERKVTAFSMDLMPRLSRAQSMDAISSQATVVGYKAVLLAAEALGKFFPMLTTAAGTIAPAKILVVGAGVAGLMAIATARRLGAVVEAFDIRPGVKEEVQSLGANFVEVTLAEETAAEGGYAREVSEVARKHEQEILRQHIVGADVVITTAQVPGKRAPLLITEEMVALMKPGTVIVDTAAEQGGNCACTAVGREVVRHGVKILGPQNLPSLMPFPASQMYTRNIIAFLQYLIKDGALDLNFADEIIGGSCVTHAGAIRQEKVRQVVLPEEGAQKEGEE